MRHIEFCSDQYCSYLHDQCIGATTLDEHRKHIEKDKALARRFQPVMVLEPSQVCFMHMAAVHFTYLSGTLYVG